MTAMGFDKQKFQNLVMRDDFRMAAALGFITGVESEVKFGHCPDVVADAITDVWERGATQPTYIYPVRAGETIEAVASADAADVQPLVVIGLDADGEPQTETVTLEQATPVAIPGVWTAVNRAYIDGAVKVVGPVLIQGDGGTSVNIFGQISADDQQTSQAIYRVPSNRVGAIVGMSNALNKDLGATSQDIRRVAIAKPDKVFRTRIRYGLQQVGTSNIPSTFPIPGIVGPGFDVKIVAEPNQITDVSAEFSMLLFDVDYFEAEFLSVTVARL